VVGAGAIFSASASKRCEAGSAATHGRRSDITKLYREGQHDYAQGLHPFALRNTECSAAYFCASESPTRFTPTSATSSCALNPNRHSERSRLTFSSASAFASCKSVGPRSEESPFLFKDRPVQRPTRPVRNTKANKTCEII
jgi:hypothetical protein